MTKGPLRREAALRQENEELRLRLAEAEETLRAIRDGEVDAVIVSGPKGDQLYSLVGTESIYRLIVETMKEAAFTVTLDGKILYCNSRFGEFVKQPPDRILGHALHEFVAFDDQNAVASLLVLSRQQPIKQRLVFQDPDGTTIPAHISATVMDQPDGSSICVVATDLTELENSTELIRQLRRREEELRKQREWLRVTLSSIGDAVIAADTAGRITFLNPVAEILIRWSQEEALGKPIQSVLRIMDEKTHVTEDIVARGLSGEHILRMASLSALIDRDGRAIPISYSAAPIRDGAGKIIGTVVVFQDISEKRRAQDALRKSEERFRAAIDNFPYVYALYDSDLRIRFINKAGVKRFALTEEQILGRRDEDLFPHEFTDTYLPRLRAALETKTRQAFECSITLPSGITTVITNFIPLLDKNGEVDQVLGITHDITARKAMEEEIKKSRDELEFRVQERTLELENMYEKQDIYTKMLEQRNRDLQDFVHMASHDLQEPLRKIQFFADRIVTMSPDLRADEVRDHFIRIQNSAERMQALVLALLNYSRVTSVHTPISKFNLREPADEAVADLGVLCEDKEGCVEISELPEIEADRVQMHQLFLNLIGNSLKYRGKEKPLVRVFNSASPSDPFCEINVQDNGIGFDERYLEKIFKPFQRLHGKESPYEGTGMGLAICRRIVERHDGSITAKSDPGKGATFVVRLPKKQDNRENRQ